MADRNTAIRATQLRNFSVTAEDIANESLIGSKLVDGTVSGVKITDDTITEVKLNVANSPVDEYYLQYTSASGLMWSQLDSSAVDHGLLSGLNNDDHSQYALLDGRSGGQILKGGTGSGDDLILDSTDHATKGYIILSPSGSNVGIGTDSPGQLVDIYESDEPYLRIRNTNDDNITLGITNTDPEILFNEAGVPKGKFKVYSSDMYFVNQVDSDTADIIFRTKSSEERVIIKGSGDVGVGLGQTGTSPQKTLDVSGDFNFTQVAAPEATFTLSGTTTSGAGLDTESTYWYSVVYKTADGETEGAFLGEAYRKAITLSGSENSVQLVDIPVSSDPRVTDRKIYRTEGDGSESILYFVYEIDDNTTTSYLDTVADGSLDTSDGTYRKDNTTVKGFYVDGELFANMSEWNPSYGLRALDSLTSGRQNVGIGRDAGGSITTGSQNIAIGVSALNLVNTGSYNIGIGYASNAFNTDGIHNLALGYDAVRLDDYGGCSYNVGLGAYALYGIVDGNNYNTAAGYRSGRNFQGSYNIFLGYEAGYLGATTNVGDYNILIGKGVGGATTAGANYNVLIGYDIDLPVSDGDNQLSIGNLIFGTGLDGTGTDISTGSVGIGAPSPDALLTISGARRDILKLEGDHSTTGTALALSNTQSDPNNMLGFRTGGSHPNKLIVTRFQDDWDVSESIMTFDGSSSVGIGTTSPDKKLNINVSGSDEGVSIYSFDSSQNPGGNLWIGHSLTDTIGSHVALTVNDGLGEIHFMGSDGSAWGEGVTLRAEASQNWSGSVHGSEFVIETVPAGSTTLTERLRIDSAGQIGIGGINPSYTLHLDGSSQAIYVDSSTSASLSLDRGNTNRRAYVEYLTTGSSDWYVGLSDSDDVGDGSEFFIGTNPNGTGSALWIETSNHVGINTFTPSDYSANADDLVVYSAGNTGITIAAGNTSYGGLYFADGTTDTQTYEGVIRYYHNDNGMQFWTNHSQRMTIESDGTLSVNTANYETLVTADDDIPNKKYVDDSIATVSGLLDEHDELGGLLDDDHTQYALLDGRSGGQTLYGGVDDGDDLVLESTTATGVKGYILLNSGGGNVGIGVNDPAYKLEVAGSIGVDSHIYHNDDADTYINFVSNAVRIVAASITSEFSGGAFFPYSDQGVELGKSDKRFEKLYTTGITDPGTGQVGIGKTPSNTLDVNGYVECSSGFIAAINSGDSLYTNAANNDINIWRIDNSGGWGFYQKYCGTGSGDHNALELWTQGEDGADVLVYHIKQSGNIGFYTDTPTHKMHVVSSGVSSAPLYLHDVGGGIPSIGFCNQGQQEFTLGIDSADGYVFKIADGAGLSSNSRFEVATNGVLSVGDTSSYEDLVTVDDHIPNKRYVDDAITSVSGLLDDHNELNNIQGGTTDQYYHLTSTQHTDLTDGGNATIHKHDDRYYTESEVTTISGDITDQIVPQREETAGNLFVGTDSGESWEVGNSNTAFGQGTMYFNRTGEDNVVVGYQAGYGDSLGDYNSSVLIGYKAGATLTSGVGGVPSGNVAIGNNAGRYMTADATDRPRSNTLVGNSSGYNLTRGIYNVAIGSSALYTESTNQRNVAVGYAALYLQEDATHNTAVGNVAGYAVTTGDRNTVIGSESMRYNQTGSQNTLVGERAGYGSAGGSYNYNTVVGYQAGYSLTTSPYNSIFGYQAGYNTTSGTGYNVYIGYGSANDNVIGHNNVVIGDMAGLSAGGNSYNDVVLVGSRAGYSNEADSVTFVGYQAGYNNTVGDHNTFIGQYSGYSNATFSNNVYLGYASGYYNESDQNVFIGSEAGYGVNGSSVADESVFIGYKAGYGITSGGTNIFVGHHAGYSNTTAGYNVVMGPSAAYYNQTGQANIVIGRSAGYGSYGGSYGACVLIGYSAGNAMASAVGGTPENNVLIGYGAGKTMAADASNNPINNVGISRGALESLTVGTANVAIGRESIYYNQTGEKNIALGYRAGYGTVSGSYSNNVIIGDQAGYSLEDGDDNVFVGLQSGYNTTSTSDNIYIGTNAGFYNDDGSNTVVGRSAGYGVSGSSSYRRCVFLGYYAGLYGTTGDYNIAIGYEASREQRSGTYNVAIGYQSGYGSSNASNYTYSTFVGSYAGFSARTASVGNTFLGYAAGYYLEDGESNVVLGRIAGYQNVDGSSNVCVGYGAGYGSSGESYSNNVFIGKEAGYNNTTAAENVFVGHQAGYTNLTGQYSVSVGSQSCYYNESGNYNAIMGYQAAYGSVSGTISSIVAIGYKAAYTLSSNEIYGAPNSSVYIGHEAGYLQESTATNVPERSVFIGYQSGYYNVHGQDNVLVGYQAGRGSSGNSDYSFNVLIGYKAAQVIESSGSIVIGYGAGVNLTSAEDNVVIGHQSLYYNETGDNNTIIGYEAGMGSSGQSYSNNTFVGYRAGYSNTGNENTFIGYHSGYNNTVGTSNISIGYESLYYNETGDYNTIIGRRAGYGASGNNHSSNTFIGYAAGFSTTTGGSNVAIGANSLYCNKVGNTNVGVGYQAGYGASNESIDFLTAVGYQAGFNNVGDSNTFIGYKAGHSTTSGTNNVFMGIYPSRYNTSGDENISLGTYAACYNQTGSHNVVIGYNAGYGSSGQSYSDNTFIGYQSGFSITTGAGNTFLGKYAGYDQTTTSYTVALGYQAGYNNTDGSQVFIGTSAGYDNISGSSQVVIGYRAMRYNQTGNQNTAVGYEASFGSSGQSFSNGVFIGYRAGYVVETAASVTIVGHAAGYELTTGSSNTFIGKSAGYSVVSTDGSTMVGCATGMYATGANNTMVGYQAGKGSDGSTTGADNVFIGYNSGRKFTTGSDNIAIGTAALYEGLASSYNVVIGFQAGYGDVGDSYSYTTIVGYKAGRDNKGSTNTFIGAFSGYKSADVTYNTAVGYQSFYHSVTGEYNTCVGDRAGYGSTGNSYNYCTFVGYQAGYNNQGNVNSFVGHYAGLSNTTGSDNVAVGVAALYGNVTGDYNTCIGRNAGRGASGQSHSNNTLVGYQSGYSVTTSPSNVFMGYQSGLNTTSGTGYNVAVGTQANYYNETGEHNTVIGYRAGWGSSGNSFSNNTFIGSQAGEDVTNGTANTLVGRSAGGSSTDSSNNTCVGYFAGASLNTSGSTKCEKNTIMGSYAGYYLQADGVNTASRNTVIGYASGYYNQEGSNNTIIGDYAGYGVNGSSAYDNNVLIGYQAADSLTTGDRNTVMGTYAADELSTGADNVVIGYTAGFYNESGVQNVVIGREAGYGSSSQSYSYNTFMGHSAGYSITTGEANVFLGYKAGYYETGSNKLFIDDRARSDEADARQKALVYGIFADTITGQSFYINGDVGIELGYTGTTPNRSLDISGDVNFTPVAAPEATFTLSGTTTSGAGLDTDATYWYSVVYKTDEGETEGGYKGSEYYDEITLSGSENSVQLNNIPTSSDPRVTSRKIYRTVGDGNESLHYALVTINDNTTTSYLDTVADGSLDTSDGTYRKDNTTVKGFYVDNNLFANMGEWNCSYGLYALDNVTSGRENIGLGRSAATSVTAGSNNIAVGFSALSSVTTGENNVGMCYAANAYNQAGDHNIAIGYNAVRVVSSYGDVSYNVGLGGYALQGLDDGNNTNVGIGYGAGQRAQAGDNIYIGYYAGRHASETVVGVDNVFIGRNSGEEFTGAYNVCVGSIIGDGNSGITGDENVVIGYAAGHYLTSSTENVLVGYKAGYNTTSGSGQNVLIGNEAGIEIDDGYNNVAIGHRAGYTLGSNEGNTLVGFGAGRYVAGSDNVFIGRYAGYYETGSDKFFIDNTARADEADARTKAMMYGVFSSSVSTQYLTFNAQVGISELSPAAQLHITSTNDVTENVLIEDDGTGDPVLGFLTAGDQRILMGIDNDDSDTFKIVDGTTLNGGSLRLAIETGGDIGINTSAPDSTLHVVGQTTVGGSDTSGVLSLRRQDTSISATAVLGQIKFTGDDAAAEDTAGADIYAEAAYDWGSGDNSADLVFRTVPDNSSTLTERLRIDSAGRLSVGTTDYETLVTSDDDIPNKKYVDDAVATGSGAISDHGRYSISNGSSEATISFLENLSSTNYTISTTLQNTTDASPSIYTHMVTDTTVSGFIVKFSGDMDSANYVLNWSVIED